LLKNDRNAVHRSRFVDLTGKFFGVFAARNNSKRIGVHDHRTMGVLPHALLNVPYELVVV
jgi:hypothetical protein